MSVDPNQYPVFYAAVFGQYAEGYNAFGQVYDPTQPFPPPGQQGLDIANRAAMMLGFDAVTPGGFYQVTQSFALFGLPPISLPAGTPIPPLSPDLLSQLLVGGVTPSGAAATSPPVPAYVPPGTPATTPPVSTTPPPVVPSVPGTTPPAKTPTTNPDQTPTGTFKPQFVFSDDPISYCQVYPLDPLCQYFLGGEGNGAVTQAPGVAGTILETVTIVEQGLSGTDVDGIVSHALGGLWGAVVGAVDLAIAQAIAQIQNVLTDIGNALKAAYAILSRLAGFILNFLQWLWDQVVKAILTVLQDIRNLLAGLYKDVLVPMVNGLANLRQWLLNVYQRFIRPMLIVLQDVRRVLTILAAFHVGFASKLDAKLQQLEAKITQPFFYLLGFSNAIANWINLIVAANYLLQKPLFLASLKAYVGESLNLQLNAMNTGVSGQTQTAAAVLTNAPTAQQSKADVSQFLATGSGSFAAPITAAQSAFDQYVIEGN